jgi:hypothetical protein
MDSVGDLSLALGTWTVGAQADVAEGAYPGHTAARRAAPVIPSVSDGNLGEATAGETPPSPLSQDPGWSAK